MTTAERLIGEIMAASRIPSARRRREVLRELRAHVEDFVSAGRQRGRSEEDSERLLLERFGDPRQIAQQFAWVYRRERAALHLGGFLISTVLVSLVISAAAMAMQAGMAFSFGAPVLGVAAKRSHPRKVARNGVILEIPLHHLLQPFHGSRHTRVHPLTQFARISLSLAAMRRADSRSAGKRSPNV